MLRKKSKEEIEREIIKRVRSLTYPILFSILTLLSFSFMFKSGCTIYNTVPSPLSWDEFLHRIPVIIIISGLVFIIIMIYQHVRRKIPFEKDSYICLKCEKEFDKIERNTCDCGGEIVSVREVEWIEKNEKKKFVEK